MAKTIHQPREAIRILLPSLDEESNPPVLRGVIDPDSLACLRIDPTYQRERLSVSARREISKALEAGEKLPDIELGMRGDRWSMPDGDKIVDLEDPVFNIDGQQRVASIMQHLQQYPEDRDKIRLGTVVHFNTTQQYERDRFRALNLFRTRVSASVLLRNMKEENEIIATLYGLSQTQPAFPLYHKVCWQQSMNQGHIISALTFCQVTLAMHRHLGNLQRNSVREIPDAAQRLKSITGLPICRNNLTAFWEMIDSAFGLRDVARRDPATQVRSTFLNVMARVVSDHHDFWTHPEEKRLVVPDHLKRKLARFQIQEPEIVRLANSSGKAAETLYFQIVLHLNSGKRTRRLNNRYGTVLPPQFEEEEDDASNA